MSTMCKEKKKSSLLAQRQGRSRNDLLQNTKTSNQQISYRACARPGQFTHSQQCVMNYQLKFAQKIDFSTYWRHYHRFVWVSLQHQHTYLISAI